MSEKKNKIKEFRKRNELTQTELAKKLNITLRTVQNWEAGHSNPPPYIYHALGIID